MSFDLLNILGWHTVPLDRSALLTRRAKQPRDPADNCNTVQDSTRNGRALTEIPTVDPSQARTEHIDGPLNAR